MRKLLMAVVLVVVLVAAIPVYFRVGWNRMTDECGFGDNPLERRQAEEFGRDGSGEASVDFSWKPTGGFTCTYSSGRVRQSYWF